MIFNEYLRLYCLFWNNIGKLYLTKEKRTGPDYNEVRI